MHTWLAKLRHDLVKRFCWAARDRREMGGAPHPGELVPKLFDDEGRPIAATELWSALRADAPATAPPPALDTFARALGAAVEAANRGDVEAVLSLDADFAALARAVEGD